jgi:NADPH-dependent curcumin reductase CurA
MFVIVMCRRVVVEGVVAELVIRDRQDLPVVELAKWVQRDHLAVELEKQDQRVRQDKMV